jgi:hypothetical protein
VDQSRVTIDIRPLGTGCELSLAHAMDPQWADFADRVRTGWTTMLDALARALVEAT